MKLPVRIIASVLSVCLVAGASLAFTVNSSSNAVIVDADTESKSAAATQEVTQSTQEETATAEVREASEWLSSSTASTTASTTKNTTSIPKTTLSAAEQAKADAEDGQKKKATGPALKTEAEVKSDVTSIDKTTATVTANTLNIRKGAGTSYSIVTTLSKGAKVTVTGIAGDWYQVEFTKSSKSYSGYAYKSYIELDSKKEIEETAPPTNGWYTDSSGNKYLYKNGAKLTGLQTSGELKYYFNSSGVLQTEVGIDVSKWNGNINWTTVKESGIDFAMIRVGNRGYGSKGNIVLDPYFEKNIKGAMAAGLKVGVYFYTQAITTEEAIDEAKFAIKALQDLGIKASQFDYPVAIDIETPELENPNDVPRTEGNTKELNTEICIAFCNYVKNAGYKPMVYANQDWLTTKLNTSQFDGSYPVWLAHYTTDGKFSSYSRKYSIWQYTSKGTGSKYGMSGNVDLNLSFYPKNKS